MLSDKIIIIFRNVVFVYIFGLIAEILLDILIACVIANVFSQLLFSAKLTCRDFVSDSVKLSILI